MSIAYKSAGTGATTEASGGDLAPTCPATVDAGDILIAHVGYEGTATTPSTPSGWALLSGPHVIESAHRHWIFGKIAAGTEDGAAISFGTPAVTTMRTGRIYSFSGRVGGTITALVPAASFAHLSHGTDPQMPTVTTTKAGALAVACTFQLDDNPQASATGESGGDWAEISAGHEYVQSATTPDSCLHIQVCTPTADPGTVTGGTVATLNDPCGVIGFQIMDDATTTATLGDAGGVILSAPAVQPVPQAVTRTLEDAGAVILHAPAAVAVMAAGEQTAAVGGAQVVTHAPQVVTVGGAVTRAVGVSAVVLAAPPVATAVGAVTVPVSPAGAVVAAPQVATAVGSLTRVVENAGVVISAPAVTVVTAGGAQSSTITAAPVVVAAPQVVTVAGAVTRAVGGSAVVLAAPAVATSATVTVPAPSAGVVAAAPQVQTSVGQVTRTAEAASLILHAPAVTVSAVPATTAVIPGASVVVAAPEVSVTVGAPPAPDVDTGASSIFGGAGFYLRPRRKQAEPAPQPAYAYVKPLAVRAELGVAVATGQVAAAVSVAMVQKAEAAYVPRVVTYGSGMAVARGLAAELTFGKAVAGYPGTAKAWAPESEADEAEVEMAVALMAALDVI